MADFKRAPPRYFAEYQLSARAENLRPDTGLRSSFRRLAECCTGRAAIVEQLYRLDTTISVRVRFSAESGVVAVSSHPDTSL